MSSRKRLLLWGGVLGMLAAAGTCAVAHFTGPRHRITSPNIAKLVIGMSASDIEAALGVPQGDYGHGPVTSAVGSTNVFFPWQGLPNCWSGNDAAVLVDFDGEGKAARFYVVTITRQAESPLDRFRRWLGI